MKFDVHIAAKKNKSPNVQDVLELNKMVSKVRLQKRIRFPKLDLTDNLKIAVYSDASFANLDDKVNSARGYVMFLHAGNKACVLAWAMNKISRVVNSTLESESLGFIDAVNHAIWIRGVVSEVLYGLDSDEKLLKIVTLTDSHQLYDNIHSTRPVENYRLRRDLANIKEMLQHGEISEVRWVPNDEQLADPLTKKGADCRKLDYVLETGELCYI